MDSISSLERCLVDAAWSDRIFMAACMASAAADDLMSWTGHTGGERSASPGFPRAPRKDPRHPTLLLRMHTWYSYFSSLSFIFAAAVGFMKEGTGPFPPFAFGGAFLGAILFEYQLRNRYHPGMEQGSKQTEIKRDEDVRFAIDPVINPLF